jgi:hypothetical protein
MIFKGGYTMWKKYNVDSLADIPKGLSDAIEKGLAMRVKTDVGWLNTSNPKLFVGMEVEVRERDSSLMLVNIYRSAQMQDQRR